MAVLQVLSFSREDPAGVTRGFDLDGHVSVGTEADSCRTKDLVDDAGREGIDNQFAKILPILDGAGGATIDETLRNAILTGELLLLLELEGAESLEADDCAGINLFRAAGRPSVGTDGLLLPGQSFDIDLDQPWSRVDGARVTERVVEGGTFFLSLPVAFFDTEVTVNLRRSSIRYQIDDDGHVSGVIGGAARVSELLLLALGIEPSFAPVAEQLLSNYADLSPDSTGACREMSIPLAFEGARAHLYTDTVRPEPGTALRP